MNASFKLSDNFLCFIRPSADHLRYTIILTSLEKRMLIKFGALPQKKLLNICSYVKFSLWLEQVGVISQQSCVDDSTSVVTLLKVWVSEAEQKAFKLNTRCDLYVRI